MNFSNILNSYDLYNELVGSLENTPISVSGIEPSAQAHLVYSLQNNIKKNALVICYSDMEARAFCDMLKNYTDAAEYFPSKEYVFHNIETTARNNENQRLKVASNLLSDKNTIVVAGLDAILQYCAEREEILDNTIHFEIGKEFDIEELIKRLVIMGYSREELVEGIGQFALRGGILDIYPPDSENPVRIEFFDNETDSIRSFDAYSQRSLNNLDAISIMPVREILLDDVKKEQLIAEIEKRIAKSGNEYFEEISNSDIEALREKR